MLLLTFVYLTSCVFPVITVYSRTVVTVVWSCVSRRQVCEAGVCVLHCCLVLYVTQVPCAL